MDIQDLFKLTVDNNASDLHLIPDIPPVLRIDGSLVYLNKFASLSPETTETMIFSLLHKDQKELLVTNKELDFSIGFGGGTYGKKGRFRVNAYYQKGVLCGAFRFLPTEI